MIRTLSGLLYHTSKFSTISCKSVWKNKILHQLKYQQLNKKLTKVCVVKPILAAFDSSSPEGSCDRFGSRDLGVIFRFVTHSSLS